MKKNLAYVLYDFHTGGMETSIYNIASKLQDDFNFYFIATHVKDIHKKFKKLGTAVFINNKQSLRRYYSDNNIDIVQVNIEDWYAEAAKKAGVKRVVERTDGDRNCCKSSKRYVDHVIASTKGTVPLIAKQIDKKRITVVYNGVDIDKFDKQKGRREFFGNFSKDDIIIGRVGRLVEGKRIDLLIDALSVLYKRGHKNLRLLVVGGDSKMPGAKPMMERLKILASNNGVRDKVFFTGDVEDPSPYINIFDICTCISMPKNEGIPNSLLEPMGAGIPAIATNVGNIRELVNDENGIIIPHDDISALIAAIKKLINNNTREALGKKARNIVMERFSLDNMARRYREIYLG